MLPFSSGSLESDAAVVFLWNKAAVPMTINKPRQILFESILSRKITYYLTLK